MSRLLALLGAAGAAALAACSHPAPPPTAWHLLVPATGSFELAGAGRTGDRLYFYGSTDGPWVAFVDKDGKVDAHGYTDADGALTAATPTDAGGLFLAASIGRGEPWLAEIDGAGKLLWRVKFPTDVGGEIYSLAAIPGGVVGAGIHNPIASGTTNGWLIAADRSGKKKWERRIGSGGYHFLTSVAALPGGKLLALGAKKAVTYQGWVVKSDADGQDGGELVREGDSWEQLGPVTAAPGGDLFALGGSSAQQGLTRNVGSALVERIAPDGKLVWRTKSGEKVVDASTPVAGADGVSFVAATLVDEKTGDLWLVRVSADGKKNDWAKLDAGAVMMDHRTSAGFLLPEGKEVLLVRPAPRGIEWKIVPVPPPGVAATAAAPAVPDAAVPDAPVAHAAYHVAGENGLTEIFADGSAGRTFPTPDKPSSPRYLPGRKAIVYLGEKSVHVLSLETGKDEKIADIVTEAKCHADDQEPFSVSPQAREDVQVSADGTKLCLNLQDRNDNMMSFGKSVRVDLAAHKVEERWMTWEEGCDPRPTGERLDCPTAPAAATPKRAEPAVFPYRFDDHKLLGPGEKLVAALDDFTADDSEPSPSGRWMLLAGNEDQGDYIHLQLFLLDRKTGVLRPIPEAGAAPWPKPLTKKDLKHPTREVLGARAGDYVGESSRRFLGDDLLMVENMLLFLDKKAIVALPGELAE